MRQLLEILNVFNTVTLKQIFWKTKTSFEKQKYRFLIESATIECKTAIENHTKIPYEKLMLRQIEWRVQKGLKS